METSKVDRRQLREGLRLIGTRLVLCVAVVAAIAATPAAWGQGLLDDTNMWIQGRRAVALGLVDQ